VAIQVNCPSCNALLKTPESSAGKKAKCPKCGGIVEIPMPLGADDEYQLDVPPPPPAGGAFRDDELAAPPPSNQERRPCPACGEMIVRDAVKCRFCGEVFDPVLRKQALSAQRGFTEADERLGVAEWLLAILCSGIGCIFGIVWMIQGKPKGSKMLVASLGFWFAWFLVGAVIGALGEMQ
jgi:DNA-directed RNA polymerase subunit M/transcription elongation factor TFIIS